ncbi:MAG: hypothetical protein AAB458_02475 [Patescibacteria group bacterium]
MISVYGDNGSFTREVPFGRHGFKKVVYRKRLLRIIAPDGTKFKMGSVVRLVIKEKRRSHGLGEIRLEALGRVVDFDVLTKSTMVLRVCFWESRRKNILSVSPAEIVLVSY